MTGLGDLGIVFLTGLTTGGLSCLAVQGGLLASSVAHQAEEDIKHQLEVNHASRNVDRNVRTSPRAGIPRPRAASRPKKYLARPIVLFLEAKLIAHILLGMLLGWFGSVLQLTPYMRAILSLAIGIFLVGTALRMLKVHPIFRYFALEPPSFLTRYIRRRAKRGGPDDVTPLLLGTLTVFIPCGVTQAMLALAIASGDPALGGLIMGMFTLGTTPIFFGLSYLATRLGALMEARFIKVTAVVVLVLGLVSLDAGLNLIGSPVSFTSLKDSLAAARESRVQTSTGSNSRSTTADAQQLQRQASAHSQDEAIPEAAVPAQQTLGAGTGQVAAPAVVTINVLDDGYEPSVVRVKAGLPVQLRLVTNASFGCTRAFVIPAMNLERILPETGTTTIDLPAQQAGTLRFTCAMGMYGGRIVFETSEAATNDVPAQQPADAAGAVTPPAGVPQSETAAAVIINALDDGYEPNIVRVRAGHPLKLSVVTDNTYGCTRAFVIPALNMQEILPETGTTVFDIPPQEPGTLRFTCGMGMYRGQVVFE